MKRVNDKRSILPLSGRRRDAQADRDLEKGEGAFASQQVPVGLERLLGMAAADAEFARALSERRVEAVTFSGVALTPAEEAVLAATPDAALRQMVAGVERRLSGEERRAFLGQAGAALLLLAAGGMATGGCDERRTGEVFTGGGGLAPGGSVKMLEVETRPMSPVLAMTGSRPGRRPYIPRKLRVRLGSGSVRGALDKRLVRRFLRLQLPVLNYCYLSEAAQSRKKPQPGRITAHIQISGSGKTRRVRLSKGSLSTRIGKCVAKALGRVRYLAPRDKKPVTVRWTFHFK